MKKLMVICWVLVSCCSAAYAAADASQQIQLLNSQIQVQLQTLQSTQQKQLQALNTQLQGQIKQVQTELQAQIQTANTQIQAQIKQLQTAQQQIQQQAPVKK